MRTNGDLSNQVKPRYRFTERYDDLKGCLLLDGFLLRERELVPVDPSISNSAQVEDDLVAGIKVTDLDPHGEIVGKLNDSAESFRRNAPDYNACLTNARVALEAIAVSVWARHLELTRPASDHRVHGERGGNGQRGSDDATCALAARRCPGRLHRPAHCRVVHTARLCALVDLSRRAATGAAATPRSGCSTVWAVA